MLIINADDLGRNRLATDNALSCYKNGRITSASAMMFMADSERSAEFALENSLDTGLHLNFTQEFSDTVRSAVLYEYHQRIATFLLKSKYCVLLYNPLLRREFDYVYKAQYEEFLRLYNRIPTHIDGHRHMHLCTNMIVGHVIPRNQRVRRNLTFDPNEKGPFNRFYRHVVDMWLARKYGCADFFFTISPISDSSRLRRIVNLANSSNVELMVHPEKVEEFAYLMSAEYFQLISNVIKGTYAVL